MALPHRNYFKIPKILVILILSLLVNGQRFMAAEFIEEDCGFLCDDDEADIFPKDALVFIGESLRLDCFLKPTATCNITDVFFTFLPKGREPWSEPSDALTIVNSTTVSLLVNINENFTGATTVECRCMRPEKPLRSIFVHAERPIKNVTDFSGVYLYKDNINLTWKLGQEYLDPFYISVVTKWNPFSAPTDASNLSCSKNTNESCMINQNDYQDQEIIFVSITVSSKRMNKRPGLKYLQPIFDPWATLVHKFEVLNNTQCDAPRDLTITDVDKSCVSVSWKDPSYLVYCTPCQKWFQIQLHDEQGEHGDPLKGLSGEYTNANDSITICDLKPFTKYSLRVQLKGGQPNPWSEWASVEATTLEDRPLTGPPMLSTNYHEENCENNTRRVYLYWNESSRDSLQGESTRFEVSFDNKTYQLRKGTNFFKELLQCDAQYNISVSSATKVGTSIRPSLILIPKDSQALPVPSSFDFKVEELFDLSPSSLKNLNITWRADLHEKDVSLFVYMCQESYQKKICFDELRVIEVNMTEEAIFLTNVTSTVNLIGYALRQENGQTRGINWTECVFLRDAVPGKPQGLRVSSGTESGSLEISWIATPCSKDSKTLIVQYNLSICSAIQTSDSCERVSVNGSVDSYTATGLLEDHPYVVSIQAETPYKLGPVFEVRATTGSKNDSGSGNVIIAVTVTVTAFVIIFIVILAFTFRKFIKRGKRFKQLLDDTLILPQSSTQITYLPQTSTESGVYTSSQRSQQSSTSESEVQPPHNGPVHPTLNSPEFVDQPSGLSPNNAIALKEISLEVSNEQSSPTRRIQKKTNFKDDSSRPLDEYVRVANGSAGKSHSHYITDNDSLIVPSDPHTHSLPQLPVHQAIYVGLALDGQSPMFPQAEGNQSIVTLGKTQQCVSPHVQEYVGFGIQNGPYVVAEDGSIDVEEADGFCENVRKAINMQSGQDYVSRPHPDYISNMDDQTEIRAAEEIHPIVLSSDNELQEVNSVRPMDLTDLFTCTGLPCVLVNPLSDQSIAKSSLASECPENGYVIHNLSGASVNSSGNCVSQECCGASVNSSNNYISHLGGSTVNTNANYVSQLGGSTVNTNANYVSQLDGSTVNTNANYVSQLGGSTVNTNANYVSQLGGSTVNTNANYVSQLDGSTVNTNANYVSQLGGSTVNTNANYVAHKNFDRSSNHSYANEKENPNGYYCNDGDNMESLTDLSGTSHLQSVGAKCYHSQEVVSAAVENGKGCDNESWSLHNDSEPLTTKYYPTVNVGKLDGDKSQNGIDLGTSDSNSECLHSGHVIQGPMGVTDDSRHEDCEVYSRGSESTWDKQNESDGYTRQDVYGASMRNSLDSQSFEGSESSRDKQNESDGYTRQYVYGASMRNSLDSQSFEGSESSRDKQNESDGYTRQYVYGASMRNSLDSQSFEGSELNVGDSENLPDSTAYQPIHFIAGKS